MTQDDKRQRTRYNIRGEVTDASRKILTDDACHFLEVLHRAFEPTRQALLHQRKLRQRRFDDGELPDFLPETKWVRDDEVWQGARPAPGLIDRRLEITGPADRKMIVNALNSDVYAYMADFEDSLTPSWVNLINGQASLYDAVRRDIDFSISGKEYKLRTDRQLPTLICRTRGWHLNEAHFEVDGAPISGALFDFGLYFFHNSRELIARGYGPYFYIPKLESHQEARLWNEVYNAAQDFLGIPRGTIRGTVLIETITAGFEMDEIIYELRDHIGGLNCGRWDYIFTFNKIFRNRPEFLLPDRVDVTMTVPFMEAYVRLLVNTCHRRGVHAMGGMSALIPIKNNAEANTKAMANVRADKLREVLAGHDGTWIAHPELAPIAGDVFNMHMPTANQIFRPKHRLTLTQHDLLNPQMSGSLTLSGVEKNVEICLIYIENWLQGIGCSQINNLMEDAATAELSRSQLWHWVRHGATTVEGIRLSKDLILKLLDKQHKTLTSAAAQGHKFGLTRDYLREQITGEAYADFLPELLYSEVVSVSDGEGLS